MYEPQQHTLQPIFEQNINQIHYMDCDSFILSIMTKTLN